MTTNNTTDNRPAKHPPRKLKRRILVFTDGTVTECGYFERIRKLSTDVIDITKRGSKDIDELVDLAIRKRRLSDYDIIGIVCDIDDRLKSLKTKSTLETSIEKARSNGIIICLSHESFEIWLLAHVCTVPSAAGSRETASRLAKEKGLLKDKKNKEIVESKITCESVRCAVKEAKRLRQTYGNNVLKDSPITDVDKLFKEIQLK